MSEENIDNNPANKRTRKKRKNFLSNAKKYAKKGQLGRGTKMSEELYQYFVGILDAIKEGIQDKDERHALVNNVLERTKDEELNVIGNQLGCRVVELLLPFSSPEDLERYINIVSPELRRLCSDNFTSHIIETLLRVSCDRAIGHMQEECDDDQDSDNEAPKKKKAKVETKVKSDYTEEHRKVCYDFTLKICKYGLNNLEDFVWDEYANHILRSALKCLSGITLLPGEKPKVNMFKETVQDNKGIPPHITKMQYRTVPDEFKDIVKEFANRLSSWPHFKDLPYKNLTSALLQVLLYAVKNVDKNLTRDLVKKLLNESFVPEDWVSTGADDKEKIDVDKYDENATSECSLPPVFESQPAVRLLEACLFVARKKQYTQLYARCCINRLARLALRPQLNYTVQRLVDHARVKEEFEPMFDELADKFGELLVCGNTGVLVALAKACVRLQARQAHYLTSLEQALKCTSAEDQKYFAVLCLRLLPRDRIDVASLDKEYFINVHGSVILQTVLHFQRPGKAVSSLTELPPEQLLVLLSDAKGSHVADALAAAPLVGAKHKHKLLCALRGYYQKLALSQYGSRAFEKLFEMAPPEHKTRIATELSDKASLMNSTQYGRLIATKLDLATFKKSQTKWEKKFLKDSDKEKEK